MFERSLDPLIAEALSISPVVLLAGARQVGKSTLCINNEREYRVFDDLSERESAFTDPQSYIHSLPKPITLDEIQKVPELFESIKLHVDKTRNNGDYLLTGSANVLDMKSAKDSLAGRIIELVMWPLSQKELNNKPQENIIDQLFSDPLEQITLAKISSEDVLEAIVRGGLPEIQKIDSERGRALWFNSYISSYVERDIRDVGELRDVSAFIRLFNIVNSRACALLNKSELANSANLSEATVGNYLSMMEMIYQISFLKAYSSNISKRFIKSPKIMLNDSGILCHILGIRSVDELMQSRHKGEVIENFVYSELNKHISYSLSRPSIYHYRTNDRKEIDFILEIGDKIIAIEVKAAQTVKFSDFKHIQNLQTKHSGDVLGIVFYNGNKILPFKDNKLAIPLSYFF